MDDYPKSISKRRTKIIYDQMNGSFYKIIGTNNKYGIGIFCKIIMNNKDILVLMTNYHLIDEDYIENNSGIRIKINNELIHIKFGDKRLNYTNKEYDLSIIEIKENKKIKINYLEIDESLYDKESTIISKNETIYILHHNNNKENEISVSYGIIRFFNKNEFCCSCNINSNGMISPIFDLNNNKLIGIYIYNSAKFVKGFFLKYIITLFDEIINVHKNIFEVKNEINMLIKIYKEDINREIYFLNKEYMECKDNNLIENNDNNIEELNEINTELYINEKLIKYKKYFKPEKEGEYKIKLKFNFNLTDCSYMFTNCENIIKIDFSLNSYFVKTMKKMFYGCINLKEVNLLTFDITNVTDLSYMFSKCENIVNLDLSSFNNINIIDINYMFYCCKNLCTLDFSNFKFKNSLNLETIFYNCDKLKNLNLSYIDIKKFNNSKNNFYTHTTNILNSNLSKRNKDLLLFCLYNVNNNYDIKNVIEIKNIETNIPFLSFISQYDYSDINSNFILVSNDILLILTKNIYDDEGITTNSLYFPQINEKIEYNANNFIVENNEENNYSLIKVLNNNFYFGKHFKIPDENLERLDINRREKYLINEDNMEESLGINIDYRKYDKIKKFNPGSPIYIKKTNQLFLIGIINERYELYLFNNEELIDIRSKINNIELKFKFYQIRKLTFNQKINASEMNFIFQYDFINLEYLNLENNDLTSECLKMLQNKALKNIKYLNLSNNSIDDKGLTYLNYLSNLNELVLLNMPNLSDDYFSFLQTNSFIDNINNLHCDKNKLALKYIHSNYNKFFLPNLNCLKCIFSYKTDIQKEVNILYTLDNICPKIIYLDLSKASLTEEGLSIFTKNISLFKKIKQIDIQITNLILNSKKYLIELERKKIKIIVNEKNQKKKKNILLGGSTISGKSTYFDAFFTKKFNQDIIPTLGGEKAFIKELNKIKFYLNDCCCWGGKYDTIVKDKIKLVDGIILLFDISNMEDFNGLSKLVEMITEFHNMEDFPVLLIGNKSDLDIQINKIEINEFLKKKKFIGYFEVSCKTHKNVEESVNFMVNYINEKKINLVLGKK